MKKYVRFNIFPSELSTEGAKRGVRSLSLRTILSTIHLGPASQKASQALVKQKVDCLWEKFKKILGKFSALAYFQEVFFDPTGDIRWISNTELVIIWYNRIVNHRIINRYCTLKIRRCYYLLRD